MTAGTQVRKAQVRGHGEVAASRPTRAPAPHPDRPHPDRPHHLPGLDGLRAVAIVAVLVFHLDAAWLPGGFLGVDVFFVVSGFLITTRLLRELRSNGRIHLPGFWVRRARRLLPAVLVCVPVSILLARLVEADLLVAAGRQAFGALTFSTNWVEISAGSDYFTQTSPQLFMNLWSLAVEEQFYLVWPVLLGLILALTSTGRARVAVAAAIGLASAGAMAALWSPENVTRVYYGTDTHLAGLMAGAALAFLLASPNRAWARSAAWERARRPTLALAALTLAGLFWLAADRSAWTFRGGILLASLASAVLVLGAVERPGPWRRILEARPLVWVGRRSYGLYLWHWPVILIVGQDVPEARGSTPYLLTRLWCVLVTVAIADLSLRFVETPVRQHGFRGVAARFARAATSPRRAPRLVAGVVAAALLTAGVVVLTAPDRTTTQELLEANAAAGTLPPVTASPTTSAAPSARAGATRKTSTTSPRAAGPTPGRATALGSFAMPKGSEMEAIGDSMLVASLHAMRYYFPGIAIDGQSNRQWPAALTEVRQRGDDARRAVVLSFGTNAGVDEQAARRVLRELGPKRMVVLVNLYGPFSRVDRDNATLDRLASAYDNVVVADWHAAISKRPGEVQSDGVHPTIRGAHLYAAAVRAALAELSERHTGRAVRLAPLPTP